MKNAFRRALALLLTAMLLLSALPAASAALVYYAYIDDEAVNSLTHDIYGSDSRLYLSDLDIEPHSDYYGGVRFFTRSGSTYTMIDDDEYLRDGDTVYVALFASASAYRSCDDQTDAEALIAVTYHEDAYAINVKPGADYTLALKDFDPHGSYGLTASGSGYVIVYALPDTGTLYWARTAVTASDRIPLSDISGGKLVYSAPEGAASGEDAFSFHVYLDNVRIVSYAEMYVDITSSGASGLATSATLSVELDDDGSYKFEEEDFDFSSRTYDIEDFTYVSITALPRYGYVEYNGSQIRTSTKITTSDIAAGKLIYTLDTDTDYSAASQDTLTFVVYTDKLNGVYTGTLVVDLSRYSAAGYDYVVKTSSRGSHTFRLSDFDDPDGDFAAADYSSTTARKDGHLTLRTAPAYGLLKLSGAELRSGDNIPLDGIRQGLLEYVPDSASDSRPDLFEFLLYDSGDNRVARDDMYIDRTAVKTGSTNPYGEDAMVAWMNGKTTYTFTLDDLDSPESANPLESYHSTGSTDGYIEILTVPTSGYLTLYGGRDAVLLEEGDLVTLNEIARGDLIYSAAPNTADAYATFTFCAHSSDRRLISPKSVLIYIDFYETPPSKGRYTSTVSKAAKTVRVEFSDLALAADNSVSVRLDAGALTDLAAAAGFTGGTLELIADVKDSTPTSRTVTLDASLFTDRTKSDVFSTIRLVASDSGQNTNGTAITNICKLSVPTASVAALYLMSTADFSMTLEKYSMTDSDKADLPNKTYNGGLARKVTFQLGNSKVNIPDATLTLPYGKINNKTGAVIMMVQQSSGHFEPALSSSYNQSDSTVSAYCVSGYVCTPYYRGNDTGMTFSDLTDPSVSWATDFIYSLAARNVVQGVGNNQYAPTKSVTRAEFIKMLVGSLGLYDEAATCSFTDIKGTDNAWAYAYIASAVKAGIVDNGTAFNPGKAIDRQTMALYAYRASLSGAANINLPTDQKAETFLDQAQISSGNTAAVTAMQRAGIIQGDGQGHFSPTGTTTRAAAAKIICMLMQFKYN